MIEFEEERVTHERGCGYDFSKVNGKNYQADVRIDTPVEEVMGI